jgi:hypothetical protein
VQGHPKHIVPSFSQLHFCKCSFSHSCITTNPQRCSDLFQLARWASQFAWNREKNCTDIPTSTARSSSPLLCSPHPQASTKSQNLRNCVLQELLQLEVWESSTSPTVGTDNHSTKQFFVGYEKKVSTILATIVTRNSHRLKFRPKTNLKNKKIAHNLHPQESHCQPKKLLSQTSHSSQPEANSRMRSKPRSFQEHLEVVPPSNDHKNTKQNKTQKETKERNQESREKITGHDQEQNCRQQNPRHLNPHYRPKLRRGNNNNNTKTTISGSSDTPPIRSIHTLAIMTVYNGHGREVQEKHQHTHYHRHELPPKKVSSFTNLLIANHLVTLNL